SFDVGVTSHDPENAGVTRLVAETAEQVIIAADYTKIGIRGVVPITPVEKINILVTNKELHPEKVAILEAKGIKVILS
ncbi:MAG TPA: alkaline phosphatase, partial [bacterium]|nr:alkaline phosphatase [bacterium]